MAFLMRSALSCCAVLICSSLLSAQDGSTLYKQHCAACHDQISPRIPPRSALQKMSASRNLRTLDFGAMMSIAYPLRRQEREAIANFLGTPGEDAPLPASAYCSEQGPWIGWSPTFSNSRFQSPQDAGLTAAQIPNLKLKWAFGFRGDINCVRCRHHPERHPVYRQRQWHHLCDEREVRLPVLDVPSQRARPLRSPYRGERNWIFPPLR